MARQEVEARNFELKAVNLYCKNDEDTCTPEELIEFIRAKGRKIEEALVALTTWGPGQTMSKPLTSITTCYIRQTLP
ncbi:MAG: hypothetical protein QXS54_02370 [Candidatus Methanomethylicaceae archaeon]